MLGRDKDAPMEQNEFDALLHNLWLEADHRVGPVATRMERMDWQNCLCEVDKYLRAKNGEGRPKQRYNRGT